MPKPFLTESHIAFIKANRFKMSASKMAIKFGCSSSVVQRYMRENGLKVPKNVIHKFRSEAHIGKTSFTPKQDVFIRENYLNIPVKTMGAMIGKSGTGIRTRLRQLGLKIPKQIVEKRKLESRFSSGHKTFNKGKKQKEWMTPEKIERSKATRFKKGNIPHNTNYNGHERVTKDGYIEVRVVRGKYRLKHLHEWEKVKGPVPDGYCLRCIDGNIKNTNPENWELITRAENMKLNTIHRYPEEIKTSIKLVKKLNRVINQKIKNE